MPRRISILALTVSLLACGRPAGRESPPLLRPAAASAPTVRVASLNALRLGHGRKRIADDPGMRALARIVGTFDIVALQEVMTPQVPAELERALEAEFQGVDWAFVASPIAFGRTTYREYCAVTYRADRVRFISGSAGAVPDPSDDFVREPFYATFRAGEFDFTLVVVHLDSPGHAEPLSREIRRLDDAFLLVQELDPDEDDVILLGDFNRGAEAAEFDELRSVETAQPLLWPPPRTSLGNRGPANPYDQVWIQAKYTGVDREWTGRAGVFDAVLAADPVAPDYRRFRVEVTDHLLVWAEFRTDRDDDPAAPR